MAGAVKLGGHPRRYLLSDEQRESRRWLASIQEAYSTGSLDGSVGAHALESIALACVDGSSGSLVWGHWCRLNRLLRSAVRYPRDHAGGYFDVE